MEFKPIQFKINDHTIRFTKEFDQHNTYRKVFMRLSEDYEDDIQEEIFALIKKQDISFEAIEDGIGKIASNYIAKMIEVAVDILVSQDIYNVDTDLFLKKYLHYFNFAEMDGNVAFHTIKNQFDQQKQELLDYRQEQRAARSHWQGGGFGLGGAVKGALMAGAMNAVTGVGRGVGDFFADGADRGKILRAKETLIGTNEIWTEIIGDIVSCCENVYFGVSEELCNQKGHVTPWEEDETIQEAEAILHNVKTRVKDNTNRIRLICQAIEKDPYNEEYYENLYGYEECSKQEVRALAYYLGFDGCLSEIDEARYCDLVMKIIQKSGIENSITALEQQKKDSSGTSQKLSSAAETVQSTLKTYRSQVLTTENNIKSVAIQYGILNESLDPQIPDEWLFDEDEEPPEEDIDQLLERFGGTVDVDIRGLDPYDTLELMAEIEIREQESLFYFEEFNLSDGFSKLEKYEHQVEEILKKYHMDQKDDYLEETDSYQRIIKEIQCKRANLELKARLEKEDAERKRKEAEEKRLEEERLKKEEAEKQKELLRLQEEQKRQEEERRQNEIFKERREAEQKKLEEKRKLEEEQRQREEEEFHEQQRYQEAVYQQNSEPVAQPEVKAPIVQNQTNEVHTPTPTVKREKTGMSVLEIVSLTLTAITILTAFTPALFVAIVLIIPALIVAIITLRKKTVHKKLLVASVIILPIILAIYVILFFIGVSMG